MLLGLAIASASAPAIGQQATGAPGGPCYTGTEPNQIISGCNSVLTATSGYTADQIGLALLRRAGALLTLNRNDDAIADLERAVQRNYNRHQASTLIGEIRLRQGRNADAQRQFRSALQINANYPEAHYGLGRALLATGDTAGAIASFDTAIRLRPGYLDALVQRAQAYQDRGESTQALADADRAVASAVGEQKILALAYRGRFRNNAKRYDDAVADCTQANRLADAQGLSNGPLRAAVFTCLGLARTSQGNLQAAKEAYDRALQWEGQDVPALTARGYVAYQAGRFDDAIRDFEAALAIQPNNQDAIRFLGLAYADKGSLAKALEEFEKAIAANANDPWPVMLRAIALARVGDRERALKDANAAFNLAGAGNSDAFLARGSVYYMLEDLEQARRDIDSALQANPDNGQAHLALARLLLRRSRTDEAARSLDAAERTIPHDPGLALNRGLVALQRKDYRTAIRQIGVSLAVNDAFAEGYAARGQAHEGLGQTREAIEDYRTAATKLALDNDGRRAQTLASERLAALLARPATEPSSTVNQSKGAGQGQQPSTAQVPAAAGPHDTVFCRMFEGMFARPRRYTGVDFDAGCRDVTGNR
ncbi:MAG: tetratricopeptide repeat protein [Hyphomicrobiaceae bacterium]